MVSVQAPLSSMDALEARLKQLKGSAPPVPSAAGADPDASLLARLQQLRGATVLRPREEAACNAMCKLRTRHTAMLLLGADTVMFCYH